MNALFKFLILGAIVYGLSMLLSGITITSYFSAVLMVLVFSLINTFVKPVLQLLSLPIILLTFGLFFLVLNAGMIMLVDWLLPGFEVANFWWALLFSFCLSITNNIIERKKEKTAPVLGETKYYRIDEPLKEIEIEK